MFLIATKQMSQSQTPLIHMVIPIFDIITRALDDHINDDTLPPAVRMAAWRGRAMLNKYYGLTDESIVYRIAMCMCLFNIAYSRSLFPFYQQCCTLATNLCISTKLGGHVPGSPLQRNYYVPNGVQTINHKLPRGFHLLYAHHDTVYLFFLR